MPDEDFSFLDVKRVYDAGAVHHEGYEGGRGKKRHGQHEDEPPKRETKAFFHTISKAVERSNQLLVQRAQPFRFCVYMEGEEVFIDLVKLNAAGKVIDTIRKNITHDDFSRWIEDVSSIEGIMFDSSV